MEYKRIKKLGLPIVRVGREMEFIPWEVLDAELTKLGIKEQFNVFFGVQTCAEGGPFPWDVEAVLERLATGNLTGSQLIWD